MRLWHYKLLSLLPNKLLLIQWKDLVSLFTKHNNHYSVNYIYKEDKNELEIYTCMVISEMEKRNLTVDNLLPAISYFNWSDKFVYTVIPNLKNATINIVPFKNYHTDSYLLECYFNLQEKYNRGCNYISENDMEQLTLFIVNQFKNISLYDTIMFLK